MIIFECHFLSHALRLQEDKSAHDKKKEVTYIVEKLGQLDNSTRKIEVYGSTVKKNEKK